MPACESVTTDIIPLSWSTTSSLSFLSEEAGGGVSDEVSSGLVIGSSGVLMPSQMAQVLRLFQ